VPSKNTGLCLSMPMSTRFIHERVVSTSHVYHGGIYRSLCSLLQLCTQPETGSSRWVIDLHGLEIQMV
jgi:hypothetical protein